MKVLRYEGGAWYRDKEDGKDYGGPRPGLHETTHDCLMHLGTLTFEHRHEATEIGEYTWHPHPQGLNAFNVLVCAPHSDKVLFHKLHAEWQHGFMLEAEERRATCLEVEDRKGAKEETIRARAHRDAMRAHLAAADLETINAKGGS